MADFSGFGVLPTGFAKMRFDQIRGAIVSDLTFRLGKPVQTRPDSVLGALIDTFADREAAMWEMAEAVYSAMYPPTASGVALDNAVSFSGVVRLGDAPTEVYAVLYGSNGTTVPAGALVSVSGSPVQYALASAAQISASAAVDVTLSVAQVVPSTAYTVTVAGAVYTYTSAASTSLSAIVSGLATALLATGLAVSSDGATVRLVTDGRTSVAVSVSTRLTISRLGAVGLFQATEPGPFAVAVGGLSQIVTRVNGWDAVGNLQPGLPGRYAENDAELRARYRLGVFRLGAAIKPAIRAGLETDVDGVTKALVYENTTNVTDAQGRPPHSVQAVVEGGDAQAIAERLFRLVAAGIDTFGGIARTVTDDEGIGHVISFSRPTPVYVWVQCATTLLPEETLPGNALATIAATIVATGNALDIGADVVVQRFHGPIYAAVPGLAVLAIKFASSTNPAFAPQSGDYTATNITIQPAARAVFDASRVQVI